MSSRGRAGPWILLALVLGAAASAWMLSRAPDPVAIAGRDGGGPPAPGSGATAGSVDKTTQALEPASASQSERTTLGPALVLDDGSAPALELEIFDVEGRPLAGAQVHVFDDRRVLGACESDERGLARVRAGEGAGRALVRARGAAPWISELDLAPGLRRIDEPVRASLHGRVRVDRAVPQATLELQLSSDRALFDAATIPAAVRAELGLDARDATRLVVDTDPRGEFAFRGLVEPFAGRLEVPERFAIVQVEPPSANLERRSVRLTVFVPRLEVELVALPALSGRVVEADGAPVARAQIEGWVVFATAGGRGRAASAGLESTRCDAEGRFALPLELPRNLDTRDLTGAESLPAIERVGLLVRRNSRANPTEIEVRAATMVARWELGDVVLPPPRELEILVRGPDQRPIEGAVVLAGEAEVRSDSGGSARIANVEDADTASVGKLGFHTEDVALDGDGPFEVVLRATNRWTVSFVDAAGAPIARRRFVLSSRGPLFGGEDPTRPARTHVASGSTDSERAYRLRDGTGFVAHFRADEEGRAVLSEFAGPFTLRVTDGLGAVLEEREIALGPEETREEVVRLEARGGTFAGRVVDNFGASLAGANVRLVVRNLRASESERSDAAGEFRFEDLQSGRVRLEIEREGFSPLAIDDYELVLDAEPVEFSLHTAGSLAVEVVDDLGNVVPVADLRVRAPQHPNLPARRRGPNRFELRELPGDPVTLSIDVGGRTFEREVDALGGDTRVVVPRHGRAQVTYVPQGALLTGGEYRVRVRSTEPGSSVSVGAPVRTQRGPFVASFDALLPGAYVAQLEWRQVSDRDGRTQRLLGAPKPFNVSANSTARVELRD